MLNFSAEKGGFACWFVETDGADLTKRNLFFSNPTIAEIVENAL